MTGCCASGPGARASRTTVGPAVSRVSRTDGSPCRLASEDRTERRSLFGSFMTNADGDKTNARDWNVSRQTTSPSDRECRVYSDRRVACTTAPPGATTAAQRSRSPQGHPRSRHKHRNPLKSMMSAQYDMRAFPDRSASSVRYLLTRTVAPKALGTAGLFRSSQLLIAHIGAPR